MCVQRTLAAAIRFRTKGRMAVSMRELGGLPSRANARGKCRSVSRPTLYQHDACQELSPRGNL